MPPAFSAHQDGPALAGSRLLVLESVPDELVERLVARTKMIRLGDPMDVSTELGLVANEPQFRKVMDTAHFTPAQAAYCSGTHVAE